MISSIAPSTVLAGSAATPIYVGSEPDKLALTADGTILWVGLDGAASVRQVNLTTNTAGPQFPIQGRAANSGNPPIAALAALPGTPNSVIVSANATAPVIYDGGVLRGSLGAACNDIYCANALQVDSTKNEIYAAAGHQYFVYNYDASGVTLKTTVSSYSYTGDAFFSDTSEAFSHAINDEIQLLAGTVYTDFGYAYNAESGSLLGTFYNSAYFNGTYPANGPAYADAALGKIFYLDTGSISAYLYQQIQAFNLSDYTASSSSVIPVTVVSTSVGSANATPSRLVRWGSSGLAFRTAQAIYSLRSNLVNDLSAANADIGVSVAASGGNTTGTTTTYVATVTNAGPAGATNVVFTAQPPSTGTIVSATASSAQCSTSPAIVCDLGGLANGASATVTVLVAQLSAGQSTLAAQVTGSENDPNTVNNQASATVTVSGSTYSPTPVATSINPAAVLSGSNDTTITVMGSGFTDASAVLVGGTQVSTSYVSPTQLSAVVPAAQLASLGWNTVSVSNPAPGGGISASLPLSIYSVIAAGANHIVYDPYTRKVMASIGSGPNANAIVAVTPETATLGTPVPIGSQPSALALTPDGQILYVSLTGSNSIARYNMLTQQPDFTVAIGATYSNGSAISLGGIAVQPGTENTIALNLGTVGTAIYDFDPTTKTATIRGQANDSSITSCPQFLDANHLLTTSAYSGNSYSSTLLNSTLPVGGFVFGSTSNTITSNVNGFVCVVPSGGLAYGSGGVIVDPSTSPATVIGLFPQYINWASSNYDSIQNGIPDTSLQRSFFVTTITPPCGPCNNPGGITAYSESSFMLTDVADLKMESFEGNYSYTSVDLVRWGQDGLAALTSSGRIYLLRGPVVVPQLLNQNPPATLTSSSATTIAHGSGNILLTLTGGNFVPGVAVTWNGSYRTTTIVDGTHLTVAIPASDLGSVGTATVVATNPGAVGSSALTITIN